MSATISASFINQFSDNLRSLVEQKGSIMRPHTMLEVAKGEKHFFDRLGSFTASQITSRLQPTNLIDPAHTRRMASVDRFEASTYLDDMDKLKMLIDPTSAYAIKLARAHGRNLDDVIFAAAVGSAATGQTGSGSTAFTAGNIIAHGSVGLTVAKLNEALRILELADVDMDSALVLAVGARGVEDLLGDTTNHLTSFDFQNGKPLSGTGVPSFRGVNIVRTQRVPDSTVGSVYRALLMTPDTIGVAVNADLEVKSAERADLNFATQISTYMQFGAVRLEEATIVSILYQ